jgi:ubiquinone/menaquinone biosynthesis C-methylase UbiE
MGWDPTWERIYKKREWGKYPSEEVIRFIARNFYHIENRKAIRILDLGCGIGPSSWFIAREGFSIIGIDGSETALRNAKQRFAQDHLAGDFIQCELSSLPFLENTFDAVIDIEALSCNSISDTDLIISEIFRILRPDGRFFSTTFRKGSWGDCSGEPIDEYTSRNISEGPCADIGTVRFIPESEVNRVYKAFSSIHIEYIERSYMDRNYAISSWVIDCRKPGENHL